MKRSQGVASVLVLAALAACQVRDPEGRVFRLRPQLSSPSSLGSVNGVAVKEADLSNARRRRIARNEREAYRERKEAFEKRVAQVLLGLEAGHRGLDVPQLLKVEVQDPLERDIQREVEDYLSQSSEELSARLEAEFPDLSTEAARARGKKALQEVLAEAWRKKRLEDATKAYVARLREHADVRFYLEEPEPLRQRIEQRDQPTMGPGDAAVLVVEFGRYGDRVTERMETELRAIMAAMPSRIEWVFFHAPDVPRDSDAPAMSIDQKRAHAVSICMHNAGQFWDFHKLAVSNWKTINERTLPELVRRSGLSNAQIKVCLENGKAEEMLSVDARAAEDLGMQSVPTFFINGIEVRGEEGPLELRRVIENEEKRSGMMAMEQVASKKGRVE